MLASCSLPGFIVHLSSNRLPPDMIVALRWLLLLLALLAFAPGSQAQDSTPTPSAPVDQAAASPTVAKYVWSQCRVNDPYIAMTFDDGPSATLTPKLLDILKERHMHVTFFLVGENAKAHPEIIKRAVAEGHEIGNHSWSHPNLAKMSDDAVRSELDRTKEAIVAAIGQAPTLMRPPYGSLTAAQKKWVHEEFGYQIILWDVDPDDWQRPGPAVVERRILEQTHKGSIILSHDIHPGTVEAMPSTFDSLLAKGFKFVTVSELIAMNQPDPPKAAVKPVASKAHSSASPKPTVDPNLPTKINGSSN